ncbi:hypothetical protein [Citromicrobium bathyomarinum]|uniref:hypothetical protein n=1 Tax=Citromicrobium bathyomarinum TaxID=72174 RepID=UPI001E312EDD|nr:hypothetical protein [Citromicrobium bathyomarinum]MCD1622423.1 hypothetical protein [Citromicrobium bathyomarinum]
MRSDSKIIGIDTDPFEDIDRKLQVAIAEAAQAKFEHRGNTGEALAKVHRLMDQRANLGSRGMRALG